MFSHGQILVSGSRPLRSLTARHSHRSLRVQVPLPDHPHGLLTRLLRPGQWRGGNGIIREYQMTTGTEMSLWVRTLRQPPRPVTPSRPKRPSRRPHHPRLRETTPPARRPKSHLGLTDRSQSGCEVRSGVGRCRRLKQHSLSSSPRTDALGSGSSPGTCFGSTARIRPRRVRESMWRRSRGRV